MQGILEVMGKVAGLAGLSLGVFLLITRQIVGGIPANNLPRSRIYSALRLVIILTFSLAALGIIAYLVSEWMRSIETENAARKKHVVDALRVIHDDLKDTQDHLTNAILASDTGLSLTVPNPDAAHRVDLTYPRAAAQQLTDATLLSELPEHSKSVISHDEAQTRALYELLRNGDKTCRSTRNMRLYLAAVQDLADVIDGIAVVYPNHKEPLELDEAVDHAALRQRIDNEGIFNSLGGCDSTGVIEKPTHAAATRDVLKIPFGRGAKMDTPDLMSLITVNNQVLAAYYEYNVEQLASRTQGLYLLRLTAEKVEIADDVFLAPVGLGYHPVIARLPGNRVALAGYIRREKTWQYLPILSIVAGNVISEPYPVTDSIGILQDEPDWSFPLPIRITSNSAGRTAVSWASWGRDEKGALQYPLQIFVRIFDDNGQPVSQAIPLASSQEGLLSSPKVAMSSDGTCLVSWLSRPPHDSRSVNVGRLISPRGEIGSEIKLGFDQPMYDASPAEVTSIGEGKFLVVLGVYDRSKPAWMNRLMARTTDSAGVISGTDLEISADAREQQGGAAATPIGGNDVFVVWSSATPTGSRYSILGRRVSRDLKILGPEIRIDDGSGDAVINPSANTIDMHRVAVSWSSRQEDGSWYHNVRILALDP